jgi:hypothetical protein
MLPPPLASPVAIFDPFLFFLFPTGLPFMKSIAVHYICHFVFSAMGVTCRYKIANLKSNEIILQKVYKIECGVTLTPDKMKCKGSFRFSRGLNILS